MQYWRLAGVAPATRERVLAPLQAIAGRLASLDPPALESLRDQLLEFMPAWIEQLRCHILDAARRPGAFAPEAFQAQAAAIIDGLGRLDKDLAISLMGPRPELERQGAGRSGARPPFRTRRTLAVGAAARPRRWSQ